MTRKASVSTGCADMRQSVRMNRRSFVKAGILGTTGLSLAQLLRSDARADAPRSQRMNAATGKSGFTVISSEIIRPNRDLYQAAERRKSATESTMWPRRTTREGRRGTRLRLPTRSRIPNGARGSG